MLLRRLVLLSVLALAACSGDTPGAPPTSSQSTAIGPTTTKQSSAVWTPSPGTSWQWQLTGEVDRTVDVVMYDIDLFDVPESTIRDLHTDGRVVVCYFSAGSVEDWRPDAGDFPEDAIGVALDGWPGERWLDIGSYGTWSHVILARLDLAVARGCDGVEPDNVDAHLADTGFPLTAADQLAFNTWLAAAAHERGLSVGLKNDLPQAEALVGSFDWLLVEECIEFDECSGVMPFIDAGKAVFVAEYTSPSPSACATAAEFGVSVIFKELELGPGLAVCG